MFIKNNPIGVFDSGVGGLTVYKALREVLPNEDFIYLGDTARLPYGTKSPDTVEQYALQAAKLLMDEDIKLLVVACNTASALALPALQKYLPLLHSIGVIEAGARAAALATENNRIAVLATESTVRSGVYAKTIRVFNPRAEVRMQACNLMVALAEEGWCDEMETEMVINRYLQETGLNFDTLVLGCTHFPLLMPALRRIVGPNIRIIDSAETTAQTVVNFLKSRDLLNPQKTGRSRFQVTDSPERFAALAKRFLNADIADAITFAYLSPTFQDQMQPQKQKPAKAS